MRYDIAIIGSGPAGLEAALTAKNRNKTIRLYGQKNLSSKMSSITHPIYNYLGLNAVTGKEMVEIFHKQLKDRDIEITEERVTNVYAMGDYFGLQLDDGTLEEASTVILATGVTMGHPYPNEAEYLGRGVSYCATCDAPLYKDKDVVVIGSAPEDEKEAHFLAETAHQVTYIPLYKDEVNFKEDNVVEKIVVPQAIEGGMKVTGLQTNDGLLNTDGIFIFRQAQFPGQLVPGLKTEGNRVVSDRSMATNIPGLFVAGDIAGTPYQFAKSAGEGNVAALSAASYIDSHKK